MKKYKFKFLQLDKQGQEMELSFLNLNDFKKFHNIPRDLFVNNPLIDNFTPGNTYFGDFNRNLKDGLHLVYNDLIIDDYAYFKDGLLVDIPFNKLLFLKVILNDFKGFIQIIKQNHLDLNLITPDELLRHKKGYKYSLIEETLLIGKDKAFQFFEFLLDKVDTSNFIIKSYYNDNARKQDIVKLAIDYENWEALKLISQLCPGIINDVHRSLFLDIKLQKEREFNKTVKVFEIIDNTLNLKKIH